MIRPAVGRVDRERHARGFEVGTDLVLHSGARSALQQGEADEAVTQPPLGHGLCSVGFVDVGEAGRVTLDDASLNSAAILGDGSSDDGEGAEVQRPVSHLALQGLSETRAARDGEDAAGILIEWIDEV